MARGPRRVVVLCATAAALAVSLVVPTAAWGLDDGQVTLSDHVLVFQADVDRSNSIDVAVEHKPAPLPDLYRITESSGDGMTQMTGGVCLGFGTYVLCPVTGITRIVLRLDNMGDSVHVGEAVTIPVTVNAGPGDDWVDVDSTNGDIVRGGHGADTLAAGLGDDLVNGGGGPDRLSGESGNDTLLGRGGADVLLGGYGDDAVFAGTGGDGLYGGPGGDRLTSQDRAADSDWCGDGYDVVDKDRRDAVSASCELRF